MSIVDTEVHRAQVYYILFDDHFCNNTLLRDNVLIYGSYNIALSIQPQQTCNITILNSRIERVNGMALDLQLGNVSSIIVKLKNLQVFYNYEWEDYKTALVIAGEHTSNASVELNNITFESNVYSGGAIAMIDTVDVNMTNCIFSNNNGTTLFLEDTRLSCSGHSKFIGNTAKNGAGISIGEGSKIKATSNNTMLTFVNNTAKHGGAIYLRIDPASYLRFFTGHSDSFVKNNLLKMVFNKNTAKNGGNNIYGESFESYYCIDVVMNISTFKQTINIKAYAVGELFATVKGDVYAQILNKNSSTTITKKSKIQNIGAQNCTENILTYKLVTGESDTLVLTAQDVAVSNYVDKAKVKAAIARYEKEHHHSVPVELLYLPLYINIKILPCPRGFNQVVDGCECAKVLMNHNAMYNVSCDIDTQTINREYSVWVDVTNTTVSYSSKCSLLYCNHSFMQVNFSNGDRPDIQCLHHRSGVLCGGCQENYSLAIGSSNCLPNCSNRYLSLLVIFALAGALLVLTIKYLNLTITQGLISGLILYANIVQTNKAVLLSSN